MDATQTVCQNDVVLGNNSQQFARPIGGKELDPGQFLELRLFRLEYDRRWSYSRPAIGEA